MRGPISLLALAWADSLGQVLGGHPGLGHVVVHRIAEGVYTVTGLFLSRRLSVLVDAGIIVGDSLVAFIDCGMSRASGAFLGELAEP